MERGRSGVYRVARSAQGRVSIQTSMQPTVRSASSSCCLRRLYQRFVLGVPHAHSALLPPLVSPRLCSGLCFDPPLPPRKLSAIARLGFGCLNKLVLEFDSAFWLDDDSFGCVRDREAIRGRLYMYWNIHRVTGRPILVALLSGDSAYASEQAEAAQLVDECLALLRRMFGPQVPSPLRSLATRWAADPFARGSYSYVAVGATEDDYINLALPVNQTLFFAGEVKQHHTAMLRGGAVRAGLRCAHRFVYALVLRACRLPTATIPPPCMARTSAAFGRLATCRSCGASQPLRTTQSRDATNSGTREVTRAIDAASDRLAPQQRPTQYGMLRMCCRCQSSACFGGLSWFDQ